MQMMTQSHTFFRLFLGLTAGAISGMIIISGAMPSGRSEAIAPPNYLTFSEWCENRATLSEEAQYTVDLLLKTAQSTDCQTAQVNLEAMPGLNLVQTEVRDLRPLATLTHLTNLTIVGNPLQDITPLSQLTKLKFLVLGFNQIKEVSPLAQLTNLTYLVLNDNQITDISALSTLDRVSSIDFQNNPLIQKACPLSPATRCVFSDDFFTLFAQAEKNYLLGNLTTALAEYKTALHYNGIKKVAIASDREILSIA